MCQHSHPPWEQPRCVAHTHPLSVPQLSGPAQDGRVPRMPGPHQWNLTTHTADICTFSCMSMNSLTEILLGINRYLCVCVCVCKCVCVCVCDVYVCMCTQTGAHNWEILWKTHWETQSYVVILMRDKVCRIDLAHWLLIWLRKIACHH